MKKMIKLSIIPLMMGATAAHATNGTNLFGYTTVNQGMAGSGLAYPMGSNSALINPALIKGNEVSFGVTYFKPTVATDNGMGSVDSAMDKSVIPNLTFAFDLDEKTTIGVAMYGSAGVGVDYREEPANAAAKMLTNLQVMRFTTPIAYQATENLRLGFAPVAQYGSLDIAFDNGMTSLGNGVSQDYGFGYEVGGTYRIPGNNIKIGAAYKSAIAMNYANQIGSASKLFGLNAGQGFGDSLDQPSEAGIGITYVRQIGEVRHVFNADYKRIGWSSAAGYSDFGWEDQSVYILGYEYNKDKWALRAGVNYSKSPIVEQDGATYEGATINYFNMAGFPATVQSHFSTGFSYNLTDRIRLDGAYTFTPTKTEKFDTSMLSTAMAGVPMTTTQETTHSQQAIGFGFNVKF